MQVLGSYDHLYRQHYFHSLVVTPRCGGLVCQNFREPGHVGFHGMELAFDSNSRGQKESHTFQPARY
jgi:hypothetical protein